MTYKVTKDDVNGRSEDSRHARAAGPGIDTFTGEEAEVTQGHTEITP